MSKDLAKKDPRDIQLGGLVLTATGTEVAGKYTKENIVGAFALLDQFQRGTNWNCGDLQILGLEFGGEWVQQQLDTYFTSMSPGTKKQCQWVASQFDKVTRVTLLPWSHYRVVSGIENVKDRKALLEECLPKPGEEDKGALPKSHLEKRVREYRQQKAMEAALTELGSDRPWGVTNDESVIECDALITDPPYGILDEEWEPAKLEEFTRDWLGRWNDCGADLFVAFWSQDHLMAGRQWFDESLTNYDFQHQLVWHYPNNKSPQSRMGFKYTWEPIFLYRLKGAERQIVLDDGNWGEGLNDFDCHVAAVPQSNFNDENMKRHPAQKPVSVMRWLVNALSKPGELVCDPFCGSGTTGIAAVQLIRMFHGIETNPEFLELAEGRIALYGTVSDEQSV